MGRQARGRRGGRRGGRQGRNQQRTQAAGINRIATIEAVNRNPGDDSGSENNDLHNPIVGRLVEQENDGRLDGIQQPPALDGASSDEEEERPRQRPFNPILDRHPYNVIPIQLEGNPEYQLNYAFESGLNNDSKTIAYYSTWSVMQLILHLASTYLESLLVCTNAHNDPTTSQISRKDILLYHAFLTLTCYYRLPNTDEYWNPTAMRWDNKVQLLLDAMPRWKFYLIRSKLKGYMPADEEVPNHLKNRGWKIQRPLDAIQAVFQNLFDGPGEILSLDEGMARGTSTRNPIYVTLGNAKPLEGYRFFLLICYKTKCCINFILDTKWLTAANTAGNPGGFVGTVVAKLCETARLPGRWYKVFMDNYYGSDQIARYLRDNMSINIVSTLQKKKIHAQKCYSETLRDQNHRELIPKDLLRPLKLQMEFICTRGWTLQQFTSLILLTVLVRCRSLSERIVKANDFNTQFQQPFQNTTTECMVLMFGIK